jgi:quinol---cytochrome-c reductase cytochrome c subunit
MRVRRASRMSRARVAAVFVLAFVGLAAVAYAQLPNGVDRPANESRLADHELGAALYAANCSACHGIAGEGVPTRRKVGGAVVAGPPLKGVGARAADFYLRNGYMPLQDARDQPWRRRVLFRPRELDALIAYLASLGTGPPVPRPAPQTGSVSQGLHLFSDHCAGCHQIAGEGGYVTDARVPKLKDVTPVQIAEAVRLGPYLMPKFSTKAISDAQLNSIIAYVQQTNRPDDRGGWGLGHVGPVSEGLVAWLVAALALVGLCVLLGERARP